jgi:FMN phosphatase YigB (HAD superfamily)
MPSELFANQLDDLLDRLPKHTQVLSLDCFDTIWWRRVVAPRDVFYALPHHEALQRAGVTASLRGKAETEARAKQRLLKGHTEVNLHDIYRQLLGPQADAQLVDQCVQAEIDCEEAHGFVFEPVLRLIRKARRRGLRVIVVSDTYFTAGQLRGLLKKRLGDDAQAIAQIYCSCDHGTSKTGQIWQHVLEREKLRPKALVHLGDNVHADHEGPARHQITGYWLRHHDEATLNELDGRATTAVQLLPEIHHQQGNPSLFHGVLAAHNDRQAQVAQQIGYRSLGPIVFAFGQFVARQVERLRAEGRPVKLGFLLRDGYLPARVCEAILGQDAVAEINVSRLTAIAASLCSREDVVRVLAAGVSVSAMPAILKQLLLPAEQAQAILAEAGASATPEDTFSQLLLRKDTLALIIERSAALRARLWRHLQTHAGVQRGDRLVLVDLGYSGTVQNRLAAVMKAEYDVELHGLYLIASRVQANQADRHGLIDTRWADDRLIHALTAYIGVFEMMCTKDDGSTLDYEEDGRPIRADVSVGPAQAALVGQMQAAALKFVRDALAVPANCRPGDHDDLALAHQAAIDLGRLIYFPTKDEIQCLSALRFDFNLGTDLILATADLERGLAEYRREGFALMNRDFTALRVSYPMELRHIDVSLSTLLLSLQRFGYGVTPSQASYRSETIHTMAANAQRHAAGTSRAFATHDGFYCLHLPMTARFDLSVLWGQTHEWLQLDAIEKVPMHGDGERADLVLGEQVLLDGVEQIEGNMVKFTDAGMMVFPAYSEADERRYMIRVVYRPLLARQPSEPHAQAAGDDAMPLHADAAALV